MTIELHTHELRVGDLVGNRKIIHIEVPPRNPTEWTYIITFDNGHNVPGAAQSMWLIERDVERIQL